MYVCVCRAVNETMIREACRNGSRSLEDVSERLGVASGCGQCREHALQTIETCHAEVAREVAV